MVEDELYQVVETCHYTAWASREIVCDRNYMEASECSRTLRGHVRVYMISGFVSVEASRLVHLMSLQRGEMDHHL